MYIYLFLGDMKSLEKMDKKSIGADTLRPVAYEGGMCSKDLIAQKEQRWLFGTVPYPSMTASGQ